MEIKRWSCDRCGNEYGPDGGRRLSFYDREQIDPVEGRQKVFEHRDACNECVYKLLVRYLAVESDEKQKTLLREFSTKRDIYGKS